MSTAIAGGHRAHVISGTDEPRTEATGDSLNAEEQKRLDYAVAQAIRDLRRAKGKEREPIYTAVEIKRATWDRIERGQAHPKPGQLWAIARALETTVEEIYALAFDLIAADGAKPEGIGDRAVRIYGGMLGLPKPPT
ncbi:helix-turn-helix domain-containing protein [Nocardia sp. XZ_19_385]|uniref:helix-turn-helix domain-containing protein n=1 Tax=Nocardia sp. XZ_19_385 TaxID=2769488 RepID=UPI00188E07C1|nr:helix-turn-helix transcriptional regulator [Nocardia sp. XZ_19_385]